MAPDPAEGCVRRQIREVCKRVQSAAMVMRVGLGGSLPLPRPTGRHDSKTRHYHHTEGRRETPRKMRVRLGCASNGRCAGGRPNCQCNKTHSPIVNRYGEIYADVAQMVESDGDSPQGRWFESSRRHKERRVCKSPGASSFFLFHLPHIERPVKARPRQRLRCNSGRGI